MSGEPASPVCYGAQADDDYMGYAGAEELVGALTELLEAERAGARVALRSARDAGEPRLAALMGAIRADEARWCAMLAGQLKRLGVTPSKRCGAFYGKAMAIADPVERLVFLNRGQAWVVRKLEALLPRVRDDGLHAALRDMLQSHVDNIRDAELVAAELPRPINILADNS
jgi:hypothetical protein